MTLPRVVMFDIDKTLARSKADISPSMGELLKELMAHTTVAIISGGNLPQFLAQVVDQLPASANLAHLYLLPTSGARMYRHDGHAWLPVYEELLEDDETERIIRAIEEAIEETGVIDTTVPSYGERIEARGSQVTLSALGQRAPVEEKEVWDTTGEKRDRLAAAIARRLPGYDVKRGGSTSVDVTRHGINKAYGVRKLAAHLSIPIEDMLYVGDELFPGGNDEVVKETDIPTRAVTGPDDTEAFVHRLLQSSE